VLNIWQSNCLSNVLPNNFGKRWTRLILIVPVRNGTVCGLSQSLSLSLPFTSWTWVIPRLSRILQYGARNSGGILMNSLMRSKVSRRLWLQVVGCGSEVEGVCDGGALSLGEVREEVHMQIS
jgi:hypothetical protein